MGFSAILGGNRYLIPLNRGIVTPVCALARNDMKSGVSAININLPKGKEAAYARLEAFCDNYKA